MASVRGTYVTPVAEQTGELLDRYSSLSIRAFPSPQLESSYQETWHMGAVW